MENKSKYFETIYRDEQGRKVYFPFGMFWHGVIIDGEKAEKQWHVLNNIAPLIFPFEFFWLSISGAIISGICMFLEIDSWIIIAVLQTIVTAGFIGAGYYLFYEYKKFPRSDLEYDQKITKENYIMETPWFVLILLFVLILALFGLYIMSLYVMQLIHFDLTVYTLARFPALLITAVALVILIRITIIKWKLKSNSKARVDSE